MTSVCRVTGIDTHAHIFHPDLPMVAGRRYSPEYEAALDDWLRLQDAAGISHGVLIQPSFLGTDNSHIEAALRAHPNRLRGVAVIDRDIDDAKLLDLAKAGFVGARLNLVGKDIEDYRDPAWTAFFERLAKLDWQVEIQRRFEDLIDIVPAMVAAGVTVVIDHFGLPGGQIDPDNPKHAAFLALLAKEPRIWVKLSAPYRAGLDAAAAATALEHLRAACGGIDRFVWGSDWPHTQHEDVVNYHQQYDRLVALLPDTLERDQVLCANAVRLFGFDKNVEDRNSK